MADLGAVTLLDHPKAATLIPTDGYQQSMFITAYGPVTLLNPPDPNSARVSGYNLAGTVDASYRPPTSGQLWPRGDLDAI